MTRLASGALQPRVVWAAGPKLAVGRVVNEGQLRATLRAVPREGQESFDARVILRGLVVGHLLDDIDVGLQGITSGDQMMLDLLREPVRSLLGEEGSIDDATDVRSVDSWCSNRPRLGGFGGIFGRLTGPDCG